MRARMTSWHLRTENFDQPAHQHRITSSEKSIVPAGSRNSAESVQMLRLIKVFAAVFIVEPDGVIVTMIVFFTIIFQFHFYLCSHDSVKRSLSVLCIRAF